jgi:hypothetical protein
MMAAVPELLENPHAGRSDLLHQVAVVLNNLVAVSAQAELGRGVYRGNFKYAQPYTTPGTLEMVSDELICQFCTSREAGIVCCTNNAIRDFKITDSDWFEDAIQQHFNNLPSQAGDR